MPKIKKIRPIHPFAARMAPEIAYKALEGLDRNTLVLDPMAGSGTVLKTISSLGYDGIGIDIDPLSVLMSKAWTTQINTNGFLRKMRRIFKQIEMRKEKAIYLPWIDDDENTTNFISFWFANKQIADLRKLSYELVNDSGKYSELFKIALSKLIIAKRKGASLAADVSHSRPHRVRETNDFDVFSEYQKTCYKLANIMSENPPKGKVKVRLGDARKLKIKSQSIDAIITSPPYLNAIDYMRGHKLALVWLGYPIDDLTLIRGKSVGAERAPDKDAKFELAKRLTSRVKGLEQLSNRKINMIYRYALDMYEVVQECYRVLKQNGRATFVIGNNTQQGVYVKNTLIAEEAAQITNLNLIDIKERKIPQNRRYLPPPTKKETSDLKNRMRTEAVMTFVKA